MSRSDEDWASLQASEPSEAELDLVDELRPDDDDGWVEDQRLAIAEAEAEARMARWDDDPNPYAGTYGEE